MYQQPPPNPYANYGGPPPVQNVYAPYGSAPPQQPYAPPAQYGVQQPYPAAATYSYGPAVPPPYDDEAKFSDNQLWELFSSIDNNMSGKMEKSELEQALNKLFSCRFSSDTCRLLLNTFDVQRTGSLNFDVFKSLIKYVRDWKKCFVKFDKDFSGLVSGAELKDALKDFGFNVNLNTVTCMVRKYGDNNGQVAFPEFIHCCAHFRSLTEGFQKFDIKRTGWANISYDQFLELVFNAQ